MTTFLTRTPITELANERDRNGLHKAVMGLFPKVMPGAEKQRRTTSNVLFRVENNRGTRMVLTTSDLRPTNLTPGTVVREINPMFGVHEGEDVRFRIAVNPMRRHSIKIGTKTVTDSTTGVTKEKAKNRMHGIVVSVDEAHAWLAEKLEGALTDIAVLAHDRDIVSSQRRASDAGSQHNLVIDTFDGIATVADITQLDSFVREGVGRARAFGCGMLTVLPG